MTITTDELRKMLDEDEPAVYLIRKRGGFYRPNSQGYTDSAIQAGRYTLTDAIRITHPNGPDGPRDGMLFVHEDTVECCDWQQYRTLARRVIAAEKLVDAALGLARTAEGRLVGGAMDPMREDICHVISALREYEATK